VMKSNCVVETRKSVLASYTLLERELAGLEGGKIQIYGASKLGWFVAKGAAAIGLEVDCFIDSQPKNCSFMGIPVREMACSPDCSNDLPVVVAIFRAKVRNQIADNLSEAGFNLSAVDPFKFLYIYFKYVAKRGCDSKRFADSIDKLRHYYHLEGHPHGQVYDDLFVSPLLVGNITQKCNIKCMDCAQLIPYYKDPKNFSLDSIVEEVRAFCDSVDLVPEISLHGGEPFLHPRIGEICLELANIPNLVFINLITNGTILPKPDVWKKLASAGVDIHQSDYKNISKRQQSVFISCEENDIYCDVDYTHTSQMWHRNKPFQEFGRSNQENDELYRRCVDTKICAQILDGRLYRCPVSAHASRQGYFENEPGNDFVDLIKKQKKEDRQKNVRAFLAREKCLTACRYCDPFNVLEVIPALQLTPRNRAKLASGEEVLWK